MEADDGDAPTTTKRRFPYGQSGGYPTSGSPLVDPGTDRGAAAPTTTRLASNFLIVNPFRSATRESLAVMGPQLGYYYPEIVLEADLHGPGINAQGAFVPGGGPYVLLGRTKDYAWSLTSASNDNRDQFLEKLCEPDGSAPTRDSRHYVYKGQCRAMTTFDAGTLGGVPEDLPGHGPRPGVRHGHGRRQALRDRPPALHLRRGRALAGRPARHDRRPRLDRQGLLGLGQPVRVHVQLGLREPRHHRLLLVRQAAAPRARHEQAPARRSAPATTTGAGSSRSDEHPHDVGGPGRALPQLEQQARPRLADR